MAQGKRNELTGECGIACAVLALAVKDVRKGNGHSQDARAFLTSPWAAALLSGACELLGVDGYDSGDLAKLAGRKG